MPKTPKTKSPADKLSAISTFVCVAESISLTAAAQKLQMSVSGVSKAVSRLEERLHVQLLNRTSRAIHLTDEGAAYFQSCKQVLLELEEAEFAIRGSEAQPRGRLRLQVPRALGKKIIVPALPGFLQLYDAVTVDVMLDGRTLNLEEEGIDIALRYGLPPHAPLVARKLCPVRYITCASPDYIRRHGKPRTPNDILGHRCINYVVAGGRQYRRWSFSSGSETTSLDVPSVLNVNDLTAAADAAANGAGIAYLTDFMAADYLLSGTLKAVLPGYAFQGDPIYMVYPKRRYVSRRVQVLRDFLRKILPPAPAWSKVIWKGLQQH